jgi:hypothetical protein
VTFKRNVRVLWRFFMSHTFMEIVWGDYSWKQKCWNDANSIFFFAFATLLVLMNFFLLLPIVDVLKTDSFIAWHAFLLHPLLHVRKIHTNQFFVEGLIRFKFPFPSLFYTVTISLFWLYRADFNTDYTVYFEMLTLSSTGSKLVILDYVSLRLCALVQNYLIF